MEPILDNQIPSKTPFYKKFSIKAVILTVVFAVLIIEGIIVFRSYTETAPPPPPKVEAIEKGQIILLASKDQLRLGEGVRVTIKVSAGGHATQGTDVILKFDPEYLEIIPSSIYKGGVYPEYPLASADNKNGLVKISGISSSKTKTFKGVGIFAFLDFKSKKAGNTKISVLFEKDKTNESNIIEAGTSVDILEKVNSLTLNIY